MQAILTADGKLSAQGTVPQRGAVVVSIGSDSNQAFGGGTLKLIKYVAGGEKTMATYTAVENVPMFISECGPRGVDLELTGSTGASLYVEIL